MGLYRGRLQHQIQQDLKTSCGGIDGTGYGHKGISPCIQSPQYGVMEYLWKLYPPYIPFDHLNGYPPLGSECSRHNPFPSFYPDSTEEVCRGVLHLIPHAMPAGNDIPV